MFNLFLIVFASCLLCCGKRRVRSNFLFDIHFSCFSFFLSISLIGCLRQLFSLPSSNPFLYVILHPRKNAYKKNSHRIITTISIISIISNIDIHFYSSTALKIISSFSPKRSCAKATQKELQYWYLPWPNAHFSHELPAVATYFLPFIMIPFSLVIAVFLLIQLSSFCSQLIITDSLYFLGPCQSLCMSLSFSFAILVFIFFACFVISPPQCVKR